MGPCYGHPLDSGGACSLGPYLVYGDTIRIPDPGLVLKAHGMDCRESSFLFQSVEAHDQINWVVVKLMVPFWVPENTRCRSIKRAQKGTTIPPICRLA